MGAGQEVAQVVELAVLLVLDVNDTPAVLAAADGLAVDDDVPLRADDSEGDHVANALVELQFLGIVLLRVEGVEADVVVHQLFPDLPEY